MIIHLTLFVALLVSCVFAHTFQHLSANVPEFPLRTGLVGDGTPQLESSLSNPYSRGSPFGTSFSNRNTIGTGTFSGYGYTPMGAVNGFGEGASPMDKNQVPGFPWGGTAYNYSSPWGDSYHPGPHPAWPKPPSPFGIQENDPRTIGLTSWNQSGVMVSNFTRFGLGGADSFSPFRQYKYRMGEIPSSWAWRFSGTPGGEPIPFKNAYGIIPSTLPDGFHRSSEMQRYAANRIMPMGSTTDQVRGRGDGVKYPFTTKSGSESSSFLEMSNAYNNRRLKGGGGGREAGFRRDFSRLVVYSDRISSNTFKNYQRWRSAYSGRREKKLHHLYF
jgi:hypothetical protein